MSRAQRLLQLLQILRRHRRPVSGRRLAEELGVSLRTLYRDIATLQQQGADIAGEAGVGYVLRPGFALPPLMFDAEELEALTLGLRWVMRRTDPALAGAARDGLAKIAAVLPPAVRHQLDSVTLLVGPGEELPATARPWLPLLRKSIRDGAVLRLHYRDAAGQASERRVWPFALGYFEQVRILVAWCERRQALRHFRVDRIEDCQALAERYPLPRQQLLRQWRREQGIDAGLPD